MPPSTKGILLPRQDGTVPLLCAAAKCGPNALHKMPGKRGKIQINRNAFRSSLSADQSALAHYAALPLEASSARTVVMLSKNCRIRSELSL